MVRLKENQNIDVTEETKPETRECLLVTSTTYKQDILNLLCLPAGLHYRFRYRERWIPREVVENPSILEGKRAFIVYFHGATADESSKEFVPIREVQIDSVQPFGDILYVRFVTGGFLHYPPRGAATHPNPRHDAINRAMGNLVLQQPPFLDKYIRLCRPLPSETVPDQVMHWSNLVKWLCDLGPFKSASFLKIVNVVDLKGKELFPKDIVKTRSLVTKGYVLRGGSTFRIVLLQRTSDELEIASPFEIELKTPESVMPIRNALVVGKYDKLDLIFATKYQLADAYPVLRLQASRRSEAKLGASSVLVESPDPHIPIRIKRMSHPLPLFLISVGVAITPLLRLLVSLQWLILSDLEVSIYGALGLISVAAGIAFFRRVV